MCFKITAKCCICSELKCSYRPESDCIINKLVSHSIESYYQTKGLMLQAQVENN